QVLVQNGLRLGRCWTGSGLPEQAPGDLGRYDRPSRLGNEKFGTPLANDRHLADRRVTAVSVKTAEVLIPKLVSSTGEILLGHLLKGADSSSGRIGPFD
ncbi:MAG: hypothetical protein JWP36_2677, partial [Paucimonas sp.]|nr:hypothetical protein [Paucimonas sp.]